MRAKHNRLSNLIRVRIQSPLQHVEGAGIGGMGGEGESSMLQDEMQPAIVPKLQLLANVMLKPRPITQIVNIFGRILLRNARQKSAEPLGAVGIPCVAAVVLDLAGCLRPVARSPCTACGTQGRVNFRASAAAISSRGSTALPGCVAAPGRDATYSV